MSALRQKRYVIVIDGELPVGLVANTAAVLSLTVGRLVEGIVGPDLNDRSGIRHVGITAMPIAVLAADSGQIKEIRERAADRAGILVVDFCDVAQVCKNYDDYRMKLQETPVENLKYLGVGLFGDAREVSKLTGNLGLLR